jgi:hypothetical protein
MTETKISDFTEFVKKHTCLVNKYLNIDIMVKDVIHCVDYYVINEISDKDRKNIRGPKQVYELLEKKDFFDNIVKVISGFEDFIFDLTYEKGIFFVDDYYLDIQFDLCNIIYKNYF